MTLLPAAETVLLHLAVALAALAVAGVARWPGRSTGPVRPVRPIEVAHLNDGPRLVVFTGLAALRQHGLIRPTGRGIIAVRDATLPDHASPLHTALLGALQRPGGPTELLKDDKVAAATTAIGVRLAHWGWVRPADRQTRLLRYGLPGWIVAAWCLVAAGLTAPHFAAPGRPLQALALLGIGVLLAVGTYMVVDVPPVTRAGRLVLRRARAELRDREPSTASWPTRVAARGEPELWRLDTEFAERAGAFSGKLPPFPSGRRRTFISRDWWQ